MGSIRRVMNTEKQQPLKLTTLGDQPLEAILTEMDFVSQKLNANVYDHSVHIAIASLCENLKVFGHQLESIYKDQLDRCYVSLRNGCRDDRLSLGARYRLLEVIELRAMLWHPNENIINYYKQRLVQIEAEESAIETQQLTEKKPSFGRTVTPTTQHPVSQQGIYSPPLQQVSQSPASQSPVPLMPSPLPALNPSEVVKNSGKFAKPIRVPGKNYCKDEIVIRNADSGKVMGLKGRRVHTIEQMSETVISFQKVTPGSRERLVQITGSSEESINLAKELIEESIRRNASPVRGDEREAIFTSHGGSSSSMSSHTSDDTLQGLMRAGSVAEDEVDSIGEYRYTVLYNGDVIKISGNNLDLVRVSKLVLDEYFNGDQNITTSLESDVFTLAAQSETSSQSSEEQCIKSNVDVQNKTSLIPDTTPAPPNGAKCPPLVASSSTACAQNGAKCPPLVASSSTAHAQNGAKCPPLVASSSTAHAQNGAKCPPLVASSSTAHAQNGAKYNRFSLTKEIIDRMDRKCQDTKRELAEKILDSNEQSIEDTSEKSDVPPLAPGGPRIKYSRDFLVECASSPLCYFTPKDWGLVIQNHPHIVKQNLQYLKEMLMKMKEKGDSVMSGAPSYLQERDFIHPQDLRNPVNLHWLLENDEEFGDA